MTDGTFSRFTEWNSVSFSSYVSISVTGGRRKKINNFRRKSLKYTSIEEEGRFCGKLEVYLSFVNDRNGNVCARDKHCLMLHTNSDVNAFPSLVQYKHVADWFMVMTWNNPQQS